MKKRIGNDITFTWHIYRKSGDTQTPESFTDKDVEVKLMSPLKQPVTIEDVSIATGVVTFTFKGKHQVTLGNYVAVLQENKGEDGMVTLDVVDAVTLVPHSYMEEDGDEGDVIEATSVELESTITAGGGGGFVQQQADWAQTDDTAVDFIKNKPNLNEYVPRNDDDGHGMTIYSPGGITMFVADEQGVFNQTGTFSAGGWSVSSPDGKLQTFGNSIYRGTMGFDHDSVVWEKTATQQIPAATTSTPGLMSAADKQKITDIEAVIPEQASSSNQLADKNFVNSTVGTNTAYYISDNGQPFTSLAALEAYSGTLTNNDYAFVVGTDAAGNTTYTRYKYNSDTQQWAEEYVLNNSSFTAEQWAAISSGITSTAVQKLSALPTNSELTTLLNGKADSADLATVATSGSYNDLSDKPTIQDLAVLKYLYALDSTNPDYPSMIGSNTHLNKTCIFGTISIIDTTSGGIEDDFTDIIALSYPYAEATIDSTTYTSYYYNNVNYLGIWTPFFVGNVAQYGHDNTLGVIKFTATQKGLFKVHSTGITHSVGVTPNNCVIKVNGVTTTSLDQNIVAVQVNVGDVVKIIPTSTSQTLVRIIGFVLEGNCGVSVFVNDAGYLTASDVADKQDKMPIVQVASGTTAINAAVNTYYEVAGEVGALAITLPTPTDLTKVSMVVVHLTAGTTPNVVIGSTETIDYSAAYDISAGNEYEINCLYNGDKWIVADMEVV